MDWPAAKTNDSLQTQNHVNNWNYAPTYCYWVMEGRQESKQTETERGERQVMKCSNRLSKSQKEGRKGGGGTANMKVNNRSERRRQIFKAASQ